MKKNINQKLNKLINEKNPYLLQHAHNPVNWYPWCEEAFDKAKNEDKPIFLSIGYSTCHWCHVMAHESFEDEEVAKLMNEAFINIKVDREERPDIDSIYMQVCQMMTGSGGWPLTVIMTPDKKPFFAGTYFPKESVVNRIGMLELVPKIKELWNNRKEDILISSEDLTERIRDVRKLNSETELNQSALDRAYEQLKSNFDEIYGGFGNSPKFPIPHNLSFLMRYNKICKNDIALGMVIKTLSEMRKGGIYDHIGFGFHRYSTDRLWLVPHFEKMLYDQALLSMSYIECWLLTGNEDFKQIVFEILNYVSRVLYSEDGGFYCAEDADSEGIEGKFYLWKSDELKKLLGNDFQIGKTIYSINEEGDFHNEKTGKATGDNILHRSSAFDEIAKRTGLKNDELNDKIEEIRSIIFNEREQRIHPFKDTKILADWNGLMMAAFAFAGKILNEEKFIEIAKRNQKFISQNLIDEQGFFIHSFQSSIVGNLDDYAFYSWGLLELYNTTFDILYLKEVIRIQEILKTNFWDKDSGAYFFTSSLSEDLIIRKKEIYDGAIPSGNSVQLTNLIKLFKLTGNVEYQSDIDKIIKYYSMYVTEYPSAYTQFLIGLSNYINTSIEIVFVANKLKDINDYITVLRKKYNSNIHIIIKTPNNQCELEKIAPFTSEMYMIDGKATVYICSNFSCEYPISDGDEIKKRLSDIEV